MHFDFITSFTTDSIIIQAEKFNFIYVFIKKDTT